MTYYDHATAMAFKLGNWEQARVVRNFELEALACEQRMTSVESALKEIEKKTVFAHLKSIFHR